MSGLQHRDSRGVPTQGYNDSSVGNEYRGNLPPDPNSSLRGNAQDGSHSAAFGLTPDGHRNTDTANPISPQHASNANLGTNDLSSVSGMDSSSNTTVNAPGDKLHVPPRGTAVRGSSDYAPESISGNVERVPTQRHSGNTDSNEMVSPITGGDDYTSNSATYTADENNLKKQGTLSKLFKRKPVGGGQDTGATSTAGPAGEERKKYF